MASLAHVRMVGRPAELDVLRSAIDGASAGSGRVVLVEGEPGIGKTRLVREAMSLASVAGMRVALGFGIRLQAQVPYAAWIDALRQVARDEALSSLFEPLGPDLRVLRALVPEIDGAPRPVVPTRGFEPAATIRSFRRALESLASDRATLVVLEDIQWLDPSSIDLLAIVARRPPSGLFLLASTRDAQLPSAVDDLRTSLITQADVDHIRLSRLTRSEAGELVSLVAAGLDPEAIDGIVDRAGGNPLFLQELAATSGAEEIPESVAAALRERLRTSSPAAFMVLRATAVAASSGEAVSLAVVQEASSQPQTMFLAALHELVDAGVLTVSEDRVSFRHALLADAVTAELLLPERRALHARVAAALDTTDRDPLSEPALAGRRAQHWSEAGVPERALIASLDAAAAARQAHAPRETLRYLERALLEWDRIGSGERPGSPDLAEILTMASEAAVAAGERRAISLVERALTLVDEDQERERVASLYQLLWSHRWHFGEGRLAEDTIERARSLSGSVGGTTEASSLATEARALMLDSRHREALGPALMAMKLAADTGDRTTFVGAAITHGAALGFLGEPALGLDQLLTARRDASDMGDPLLLTRTYVNESELLGLMGRFDEASDDALAGVQTLRDLGAFGYAEIVMTSRIRALVQLGRWVEADALLESHDAPEEGNAAVERSIHRAEIALGRGRFDEATAAAGEGRRRSVATTGGEYDAQLSDLEIRLALEHGRPHEARRVADAALTRLARWEIPHAVAPIVASGLRAMAEMAQLGDRAADSDVEKAIVNNALEALRLHATTSPVESNWLAQAEAELATVEGRATPEMWTRVADGWEEIGALPLALRPLRRAAEVVLATGKRQPAAEPLRRGLKIAESLDGPIELHRLRDLARRARLSQTNRPRAIVVPGIAERITERELEVLKLLGAGLTNREVGRRLFMSEHTVAAHVSHLLAKIGARSRAEVVANAARLGLLE